MNKHEILVIDYKVGNHQSVINALRYLGCNFEVSNKKKDIDEAKAYVLPGVGAFNEAMKNLNNLDIIVNLEKEVMHKKKPILGICLGMQVLAEDSTENGFHKGLGWMKGHVIQLDPSDELRVPHVGWNNLHIVKRNPLFMRTEDHHHFYFDHSYHFLCEQNDISAICFDNNIVAAIQKDNIFGVQFHPEKSQNNGLKLFRCFLNYIRGITCLKKD